MLKLGMASPWEVLKWSSSPRGWRLFSEVCPAGWPRSRFLGDHKSGPPTQKPADIAAQCGQPAEHMVLAPRRS